jgi:ribonuclease HII
VPDFALEWAAGGLVAGVDEAGRGPLAGPVMAAAVLFHRTPPAGLTDLLDDSKRLTPLQREHAAGALRAAARAGWLDLAVAAASAAEIGRMNILRASQLAMQRAVARLPHAPTLILVDGNHPPRFACRAQAVVGGDARSLSIAAASILAKVMRDRAMKRLDQRWPGWGFAQHQGYPTASHRALLAARGPTPHHRRGFSPVDQAVLRFG